jgi:hypothetical protein
MTPPGGQNDPPGGVILEKSGKSPGPGPGTFRRPLVGEKKKFFLFFEKIIKFL